MKHFLSPLFTILLLSGLGFALGHSSSVRAAGGTPTPQTQAVPSRQMDQQLQISLEQAVSQASNTSLAYLIYEVGIHEVQYELQDGWAVVLLEFRDPQTHEVLPTEPGLGLAYHTAAGWHVVLPNDPLWESVLTLLPNTLLSADQKADWLRVNTPPDTNAPAMTFGGYLLPWSGQETNRLTRSIAHEGQEYYAFDFAAYTPGNMFAVYAAKGGTVKYVKWNYPNGYYDGNCNHANYIVLEDTSTSPTTYQLYLHLAQNSIPQELRTHGVYVQQGQYLGMADDTGCSTGHHLHFQVHTTPAWWSTAVDITFDDVAINGGRPRTPAEAAQTGEQGQIYYTSGNLVHNPDTTPPTGGLLTPFSDNTIITTHTLTLEGWAMDDLSGVASAQFLANYSGAWTNIGPPRNGLTFTYTWDLCADAVPDGPLALALQVQDNAHNTSAPLAGLLHVFKQSPCAPEPLPPACQPGVNQVALFSEPDYQGVCTLLGIGDYAHGVDLGAVGGGQTTSLLSGGGVWATLFGQENFQGRSTTLWASDPNLADDSIGARTTQSIRVHPVNVAASIPQGQWPPNGMAFPPQASLDVLWRDSGGGNTFQARLHSSLATTLTNTWQSDPALPLGSLPTGTYTWTVRARNPFTNGISVTQWSTPYTFSVQAGAPLTLPVFTLPYTADMETLTNTWQTDHWTVSHDPAHSGHAWVVSPTQATQPYFADLTSAPISITQTGYALRFWYRANTEGNGTHWDQRWVQISVDGAPFENVLQLGDDPMLGWLHSPEIDLSPYLAHTVRVRFHFVTLDGVNNPAAPWAIDDLSILPAETFTCTESTPNDSPATATPLAFGQTYAGSICPPGDMDFFVFQGQAGQKISVDVDGVGANRGSQLDGYLFLLAEDGRSQLAEHDDEVTYQMQDPHLGFTLPYNGTYYLKLRAWDHPSAGGQAYTYTLHLMSDDSPPTVSLHAPPGLTLNHPITLTATASDNDGVQRVAFWWHSGDWAQDSWQLLGVDDDGRDGWQMPFDPTGLPPQADLAFYAEATDWAGNRAYHGRWHVVYGWAAYLPITIR
ncbi:MAG: hypothetical protein Fur0018_22010 [Anaerolineales bacterium]